MAIWKVLSWDKNASQVIIYDGVSNYQKFSVLQANQADPQVFLSYVQQQALAIDQGISNPATANPNDADLGVTGQTLPGGGDPNPPWLITSWDKTASQVTITNGTAIQTFSVPLADQDNATDFLGYVQGQAMAIDQGTVSPATSNPAEAALVIAVVGQTVQGT